MTTYKFAALISSLILVLGFQGPSMRELAKERGKSIENVQNAYMYPPGLDDLTANADVIIEGRVIAMSSHLAPDESVVMTEYSLQPTRFLKTAASEQPTTAPSFPKPITVKRVGGTMKEGEYTYTTLASVFPQTSELKVGEEVIAFLSRSRDGSYEFAWAFFGVFRIGPGEVRPMFPNDSVQRKNIPVRTEEFLAAVYHRLQSR